MFRLAHPLYRVPNTYPATRKMFLDSPGTENVDPESGDLFVFSTWLTPDTPIPEEDKDDWGTVENLGYFVPEYTPTPEEVVRALRGPQGNTGPMGPMGMSAPADDTPKDKPQEGPRGMGPQGMWP